MRAWLIAAMLLCQAGIAQAEEWKNWFDDPFFQARHGVPTCPTPAGPLLPLSKRNGEAHYRIERGTSCWLAGQCSQPNAYLYDTEIGKALALAFSATADFADTSLWLTVQRRFVIIQGCIANQGQKDQLEKLAIAVPNVERVIVELAVPSDAVPPYTTAPAATSEK